MAWKDEDYYLSLTPDQRAMVPSNPASFIPIFVLGNTTGEPDVVPPPPRTVTCPSTKCRGCSPF